MILDVHVDTTESCFHSPDWQELVRRDPDAHVFATPEWNRVWWEQFGAGKDLFILTMRSRGELVALVPLYRKMEEGRAVLRFVGGVDLTDYLGPICSLDDREPVAATLVDWLSSREVRWDELDAHNMPVPFGFADFLTMQAQKQGFEFTVDQEETSAVLLLPSDWEVYLKDLDSKERHELRRKRRRLARVHPDAEVRTSTRETLERDLDFFVEMHRGAEGDKGDFMNPEIAAFFRRLARAFMDSGSLRLSFLEIAGSPISSTFGFRMGTTYYLYNSAYEPEAGRVSPGLVLVSELVKSAIEAGIDRFDFLRGPERYKYQLGAEAVPLHNVRILHSTSPA